MKFPVVAPPKIVLKEQGYRPVEMPKIAHESRNGFTNKAIEIYNDRFGKGAFNTTTDLPMPMPDPSFMERFTMNNSIRTVRVLLGLGAYFGGQRGTHPFGVGGKGKLKILNNPAIPENEFFKPGKEFDIRVRYSNAAVKDDATAQVRGMAIKFADTNFESPLDLFFNTGPIHPFWSMSSLWTFMKARMKADDQKGSWESQRPWLENSPAAYMAAIECMRNAPACYSELVMHSMMPFPIKGKDGITRYIKYRVVPKGLTKESGMLTYERQQAPWRQSRDEDNTQPERYLGEEYHRRIGASAIEYDLQIQLREFDVEKDTSEFFNSVRYWNECDYPWLSLAEFEVNNILPENEMQPMRMFIGNTPPSHGIIESYSKHDYNSVNWGRALAYNHSWRQRKRKNKYS